MRSPTNTNFMQLPLVKVEPGEKFSIQLALEDVSLIEAVWIWSWALIGGILAAVKAPFRLGLAVTATLLILSGCCWILLVMGYWVPLVPSVVVAIATLGIYRTLHKKGRAKPQ